MAMSGTASAVNLPEEMPDAIDCLLQPLLSPIATAVRTHAHVAALTLWTEIPFAPLLPSHLHLRWPGAVDGLPLTPRIAYFSISGADWDLLCAPNYHVADAHQRRQAARAKRFAEHKNLPKDFYPDWEQAVDRKGSKLDHLTLPATSFLSVDEVEPDGELRRGTRPVLGRYAPHRDFRPQLLTQARGTSVRQAAASFSASDLVVVNAQRLRTKRIVDDIRAFLQQLPRSTPCLIVTASPNDIASIGLHEDPSSTPIDILGRPVPSPDSVAVSPVGRDRVLAERQFDFSVDGLPERSEDLRWLVSAARRAWWAVRQNLSGCEALPWEAQRFEEIYTECLTRRSVEEVELLEGCKNLIVAAGGHTGTCDERREALCRLTLHDPLARNSLILTRSASASIDVRQCLASTLSVEPSELAGLGITIQSVLDPWLTGHYDTCIATGYFGPPTIDALIASRAPRLHMIVDPIEACVAVWDIRRRFDILAGLPTSAQSCLARLCGSLQSHAAQTASEISIGAFGMGDSASWARGAVSGTAKSVDFVSIYFIDGHVLESPSNARFEVLGKSRLRLQTVPARLLNPGDRVVTLHEDSRIMFSERLLAAMDEGKLRHESKVRAGWISLVRSVCTTNGVSASALKKSLEAEGLSADLATVRTWISEGAEYSIPESEPRFLALARALGLAIPEATLKGWFAAIDRLRVAHRRLGRHLVKAIRAAYLGRLDAGSIGRIERDWGVEAKKLLEAARVATVDCVVGLGEDARRVDC
jgi:hypothetical protein